MTRALGFSVLLTLAAVLAQTLYEIFVVPRLPEWDRVPIAWWLLAGSPILVAALVAGFYSVNLKQLMVSGVIAALLTASFTAWAAHTGRPGHLKSFSIEAPIVFWLSAPVFEFLLLSVPMAAAYYLARVVRPGVR